MALSAPTGKAAARLQEAVQEATEGLQDPVDKERLAGLQSSTLHRLLGWRRDSRVRFRHHRANRLPYDVVVVDETSMVSLTMMARLLEAMRPDARLVLVGDPDQLASVEAGAVLADLVAGFEGSADSPVSALVTTHRFGQHIGALAQALRDGDADKVMAELHAGSHEVELVDPLDDAAMTSFRTRVADVPSSSGSLRRPATRAAPSRPSGGTGCCAPTGRVPTASVAGTDRSSGSSPTARASPTTTSGTPGDRSWSRPTTTTSCSTTATWVRRSASPTAGSGSWSRSAPVVREFATTRLSGVETVHAMTVHKSQGSQAHTVSVVLPDEESRLLTRELFYTAVTRAQEQVRVVGTEAAIRAAVGREVQRASGLGERLADRLRG